MSEIRELIEKLVGAGVDPVDAAEVVSRAVVHGAANAPKQKTAGAIRQERYRRNKASQITESDGCDAPSSDKEKSPTPPKEINSNPKEKTPKGVQKKTPRAELQTVLNDETADAVLEHRQRLRKPLTAFAARSLAGQFAKCRDPNAAAAEMIEAGWQGFKPEWLENRRNSGQGPPPKPNIGQQINNRQKRIIAGFMGENIDERYPDDAGFVDLASSDYRFGD